MSGDDLNHIVQLSLTLTDLANRYKICEYSILNGTVQIALNPTLKLRQDLNQKEEIMPESPFSPTCLSGKVALVTGGGSGICYAVTKELLSHGCDTAVILGRRLEFLKSSAASLSKATGKRVLYQACDVRNAESCVAAVKYTLETCGRLDILINGAAGNFLAEAKNLRPKGFKTVMEIDTIGTYNMCHAACEALTKSKGSVINISATLQYGATWYQVHASAAKSAVDSLTRTLALEWGYYGVRVNGIAPGPIADTPGMAKVSLKLEIIHNIF